MSWLVDNEDDYYKNNFTDLESTKNQLQLREWQREAKDFFNKHNGISLFEVVTGGGKTYITVDIIKEKLLQHPDMKVLVVVPKNVILETGWYKELSDFGIPIQDIGVYYGSVKEYSKITLTNIQSVSKIPLDVFDMIIADEVHNMATERLLKILEHPFKYKLGLTATLKRIDNKHYDILKLFNYNMYEYKPTQAMEDGVLNPFIFYNISVDLDYQTRETYNELTQGINSVYKIAGSYNIIMKSNDKIKYKLLSLLNERKQLVNNYFDKFEVARQIINQNKDKKIIVFNQFNDQTSKLYWHLLDDNINCRVMHSGIEKTKRENTLIDFKNDKFNVLLTSKVLDEGYNLPKLDVAIIMAGDSTDKQTIQRMGRVLRKKENVTSKLYQIFCSDTIEENNSIERSKIFKSLSTDYKDITYEKNKIMEM